MNYNDFSEQGTIGCIEDDLQNVVASPQHFQRAGDTSGAITVAVENDCGQAASQIRRLTALADRWGYTLRQETETANFVHVRLETEAR